MVDSQHVLTVVWKQVGLDTITSGVQNLEKTSQTAAKSQDTLSKSLTGTSKSASTAEKSIDSTGKSLDSTSKSAKTTTKETQTLGQAFKGSALLIAGFASSLVNTYMQYDRVADQSMRINKMRAQLDAQTNALSLREIALEKSYAKGNMTSEQYRLASEKLAAQREKLSVQEQIYTDAVSDQQAAMLQLATSVIPTVATGWTSIQNILSSLKNTHDVTKASTDLLTLSTTAMGTAATTATTSGITPLQTAMNALVPLVTDTTTQVGDNSKGLVKGMVDLNTNFTTTEKSGNVVINAFKNMGKGVKDFFNTIKIDMASSTGIVDKIKAGFSSFFSILGKGLKEGIKAVIDFGKAMIAAIVSNPVLLVITAISTAVLALITNFGGFRDMINSVGVAIGNAIPGLKGFLDWFGAGANAALDAAAGLMGFETQAKKTGQTAAQTATAMDPLLVALDRYLILGGKFEKVSEIEKHFVKARVEITNLGTQVDTSGKLMAGAMLLFGNAFEEAMADIPNKSEPVKAAIQKVHEVVLLLDKGGLDLATTQKMLTEALNGVSNAAGTEVEQVEKTVVAQQLANEAAAEGGKVMTEAEKILTDYTNSQKLSEAQFKEFALAYVQGNYDIIEAMGLSREEIIKLRETFDKEFASGAIIVEKFGEQVVVSIDSIREQFGATSKDITTFVDDITKALSPGLVDTFAEAQKAVSDYNVEQEYLKEVSHLVALGVTKDSELWAAYIDLLIAKYPQLGKTATEVKDDIVKALQDQEKSRDKENQAVDKQIEKAKSLAQTRREEIQADQALATEAEKLIATMGKQITVTGMSGKGLQSLIQIYDDTANATTVAADAIGLWYAELQKNQAVDAATVEKLDKLATSIGTTIPEEIRSQGIPAIKAYIEQFTGMGEGAKKVKEEILKTFEDLKNQTQGLLDGIISDKLGEDGDEIKKVLKGIEKAGYSLNSFVAEPRVISIFMDDQKFDNDLQGFSEILAGEMDRMGNISAEGGDRAITTMIEQMRSTLGEKGSTIMEDVDLIWKTIQDSKVPGETGNITTTKFAEAMKNPTVVAEAIRTNNTAILAELGLLPPKVAAEAGKVPTSAATAIKNQSGTPAEEMRNMGILMVGQLNLILSDEVNTTLPGYINMFATKFTEMGNTAANLATAAETHFKTINDAMLLMQTNVSSLYKVWDAVMKDADQSQKDFVSSSTKSFETTDKSIQLTETNTSSLYKVWDAAMDEMTNKVDSFAKACETAFKKVGSSADTARKAVEALQKAIDNLKDKTVTITYKIETVGTPPKGARFGGSTVLGYAQRGAAWIQSKPRNIGGMNTSEFSKPELITATPLSNPYNTMDKSISLPTITASSSAGTGGGSPIVVTGDLHVVVQTQSGETLAKEIKPYLLRGFSGIT